MNCARIPPVIALGATLLTLAVFLSASIEDRPTQPPSFPAAEQISLAVDPSRSTIHWTLGSSLHTVHGTFGIKRGALLLDPDSGKVSGEIVADAASGQSGNGSRDNKMHKEILESARYSEIVFRPDRYEGKLTAQGESSLRLHGILTLHGADHELTVPVQGELTKDHWNGTAKFGVPYIQWGLRSPNNFFLKADPVVSVELELSGDLRASAALSAN
jgi:polyisoprenoid-binding protein YceI